MLGLKLSGMVVISGKDLIESSKYEEGKERMRCHSAFAFVARSNRSSGKSLKGALPSPISGHLIRGQSFAAGSNK
jgi:hypothetical protein